jgi:hypothetical protein
MDPHYAVETFKRILTAPLVAAQKRQKSEKSLSPPRLDNQKPLHALRSRFRRNNADALVPTTRAEKRLKLYPAVALGKEGVVAAHTHVVTGVHNRTKVRTMICRKYLLRKSA